MNAELLKDVIVSLRRNRTRSLLAGLALASGVFVLLVAIAGFNVFNNGSFGEISRSDLESVSINPSPTVKDYEGFGSGRIWTLEKQDIDEIRNEFGSVLTDTGPVYVFPERLLVLPGNGKREYSGVIATYPGVFSLLSVSMVYGRFIDEIDMAQRRKTCVVGRELAERWFGKDVNPCGKDILIGGISFNVVGVLKKDNSMVLPFGNEAKAVLLPYSTADAVFGLGGHLSHLAFSLATTEGYEQKREDIIGFVKQRHKVDPQDKDAAKTISMQEYSQMLKTIFDGIDILFWVVFIGIILSSILGVFGIMLLSVRERKNEIGIRLSMGALPEDIQRQFAGESLIITFAAFFLGLGVAELLLAVGRIMYRCGVVSDPLFGLPQFSFGGVIVIMCVVLTGGVLSGYLPARKMAGKKIAELLDDLD